MNDFPFVVTVLLCGLTLAVAFAVMAQHIDRVLNDRSKYIPRDEYDTLLDEHMLTLSDRSKLIEACSDALKFIEREVPRPDVGHLGPCGPESCCDGNCMDAATFYTQFWTIKNTLLQVKERK